MARLPDSIPLNELRRALVVNLRHHGDVLLSSPVLSVLKQRAPDCEIDALVYGDTAPMLDLHPALARLHCIDRSWKTRSAPARLAAEWRLLGALRERRYDLLIALTPHRRCQWLVRLLKPRWAVGPHHPGGGRSWNRDFTHIVVRPIATWRHTVEVYLDALRRIGCPPGPGERAVRLVPGPDAESRIDRLLGDRGLAAGGFIHIHPASRWHFKCWPAAKVAALIAALAERGWPSVLTAAPDPAERAMVDEIVAACRTPVVNLSGQLTLKELAALTARARIFVGVDSAPMHVAAAMNTPLVALFGPSGARQWGPWNPRATVVTHAGFQCVPCGRDGCAGSKESECLERLPVATVLAAALAMIDTPEATACPEWLAHLGADACLPA